MPRFEWQDILFVPGRPLATSCRQGGQRRVPGIIQHAFVVVLALGILASIRMPRPGNAEHTSESSSGKYKNKVQGVSGITDFGRCHKERLFQEPGLAAPTPFRPCSVECACHCQCQRFRAFRNYLSRLLCSSNLAIAKCWSAPRRSISTDTFGMSARRLG